MKSEFTEKDPKFNLLKPDGLRGQVHAEAVTDVLLNDGRWYRIVEGSFKFYRTSGDKAVPFVQFVTDALANEYVAGKTVEVFPASVSGVAYKSAD